MSSYLQFCYFPINLTIKLSIQSCTTAKTLDSLILNIQDRYQKTQQNYQMTEFVHNYFLSARSSQNLRGSKTPTNRNVLDPKKGVALYMAKILSSKAQKQLSFGFNKISQEGAPLILSLGKKIILNKQSAFSTQINSPKTLQVQKDNNTNDRTSGRLLKKRSSLVETRMVSPSKTQQMEGKLNPQRTYMPPQNQINKQLNGFKMMQISQQIKLVLQKISKLDKSKFATEIQKICKDSFMSQIKKLQKIKNSSKDMRFLTFDNELTIQALNTNVKVITQLNKEIKQLRKNNEQLDRQLRTIKQRSEREHKSNQKFEKHRGNVENVMKGFMNRIEENLDRRDLNKALIGINEFIKKYQKQDFAADKVYFYCLIKDRINEHKDVEKCLDQICRILGVLCIADLSQTEACLRSLNANHTAFKYLKKTYGDIDKFYGKQMTNIMHNLENFNDNIIQYLQTVKKLQKQKNKPTGIEQMIKSHDEKVDTLQIRIQQERRKAVFLELQVERKKFVINNLDPVTKQTQNSKKIQSIFEKKLGTLMQKLFQKKEYKKQLDSIRKDETLTKQKPYAQFIVLLDKLQNANDEKIKKQLEEISSIFTHISNVFKKVEMSQLIRFKEVQKILENSSKKNTFYFDLHRFLQSMMFTVVLRTKQQSQEQQLKKIQDQKSSIFFDLKQERKRNRRLSEQIGQMDFDINSLIDGGKTCIVQRKGASRAASPSPTFVYYNRQQEDKKVTLNEKQLSQKLQLFLNKVSPIIHKSANSMEDNLSEVQQLAEKFIMNNPQYKKIFTLIQNWMSFAISRLQLKQKK